MTMHWPHITMIVLIAINLGMAVSLHGKPRGLWNVWARLFDNGVLVWLLIYGGFFK